MSSAAVVIGALRVNIYSTHSEICTSVTGLIYDYFEKKRSAEAFAVKNVVSYLSITLLS